MRKLLIDTTTPETVRTSLPGSAVRESMRNRVLESLKNSPINGGGESNNMIDLQTPAPSLSTLSPLTNLDLNTPNTPITPGPNTPITPGPNSTLLNTPAPENFTPEPVSSISSVTDPFSDV
jgi:hypothetical protein